MSGTDSEPTTTVSAEDVLEVVETMEPPGVTTSDISNVLGCSTDDARARLNALHERGLVRRRKTSGIVLWWVPRGDAERPDPIDMGETNALEETEASHTRN
ncbi:MarR family transcriptional regulator [Salarchaeum sp. JOR-1]|uniref:MarR family transcriptional regulator n=1 Tax=Salarchaeum sp. JOR-1 TaxID=2599399 RepID=UPI001198484A|nr:MarR family transcriptional regulator [Salarchaeum sp. JOR-1]QDX40791.1 hypothetical protein FQU85_07675 [Salarchaeum sp. JOR-1]